MNKFLFILLFASCTTNNNPKEAIVERQKAIKKEMAALQDSVANNPLQTTTTGQQLSDSQIANSKEVLFRRQALRLQTEYDSLEIELKKY